jgi:hypothetical protein
VPIAAQNQRLESLPKVVAVVGAFGGIARGFLALLLTETGIYV